MNHNNSSRYTSFAFTSGSGGLGGRAELSSYNLSRTLSSPMAESTHLDTSGARGNLYGSPIRQHQQQPMGVIKRKPTSPLQNRSGFARSNGNLTAVASTSALNRIDPLIYTDAQSRGLVTRLIKYHDKTQSPLNRSQSMNNLYTKPGQFPVVHLKKTEIKYSPRRNNSVTSVRIAPPEKSVFQANTRSNILRAGSLLIPAEPHLKMARTQGGKEIDAENRVIAPTAELETAPTRSVLDALKEISRKRINNEELDADRIKKQCKELSEVDSGGGIGGVGTKRTRELAGSASPPSQGSLDQQKKRLCSKNNDISSSLSSSLVMNTPKRAADTGPPRPGRLNIDQTFSTPAAPNLTAAETRETVKVPPVEVAPLPTVVSVRAEMLPPPAQQQQKQPKLTLFNKKYDETVVRPASTDSEDQGDEDDELGTRISFIKPKDRSPILSSDKIALKKVERSKLSLILSCLSDNLDSENEASSPPQNMVFAKDTVDAAPKVTEKKQEEVVVPKLSGISALINSPIKDPGLGKIEPILKPTETVKSTEIPKPAGGFTLGSATATPAVGSQAVSKPVETSFAFGTPTKAAEVSSGGFTFGTPSTPQKSDAPPSYNFSSTVKDSTEVPTTSSTAVSTAPPVISSSNANATVATPNLISFSPAPVKPSAEKPGFTLQTTNSTITPNQPAAVFGSGSGFSAFKPPNPSVASVSAAVTNTTTSDALPGAFGNSISSATSTASSTAFKSGSFSFEATPSKPSTTSASGFSFGGNATTNPPTAAVIPTAATTVSTNPAFGSFRTTAAPTAITAPTFGTSATASTFGSNPSVPTFGSNNAFGRFGANNSSTSTSTSNVFGASSTTTTAKTGTKPPTFGQSSLDSSFSFKANPVTTTVSVQPSNPQQNLNSSFSFGAPGNTNTTTTKQQPMNIFGSAIANNTNNKNNSTFGAIAATNPIPAGTFGAASSASSGAPTNQSTPFGTGSNSNNSSSSVFGSSASSTARGNATFGAAPVFGTASGSVAPATAPSTVFGNASNSNPNPFGSTGSMSHTAAGMFGSSVTSPVSNNNNNSKNQMASSGSAFTFGSSSSAATPAAAAPQMASKPFAFGGPNNNSSITSPVAAVGKSNSFSFLAGSNTAVQPTAPSTGSSSAFSFGAAAANNNTSNAAASNATFGSGTGNSFTFSSNAPGANSPNQATVKPFSFGGASNANQSSAAISAPASAGGIFGSATPIAAVSPSPPAFNFSAGSNQPGAFSFNSPAAAPLGGGGPFSIPNGTAAAAPAPMFSIGTGGGNQLPPNRRPIRQATRRHK
ncbi:streptococcal hemagglutinin [Wyeomyia smithii]|uniref:streptococcal hemagglutinin n=1 Tax=Wyeomyia smithii TaxID=174621 RepID=UPI002467CF7D|nr:streptococcal hemagglutinin [Wyeomyia smithii]XP_055544615.1 streptococcal hemagglutinin [Wyeomyia smithii]